MAVQKIVLYGANEVLRAQCREVDFDRDSDLIKMVAQDLIDTLDNKGGLGLAAPQIGVPVRIITLSPELLKRFHVLDKILINPVIVESGDAFHYETEGCLSIPGVRELVGRSGYCKVRYMTLDGQTRIVNAYNSGSRLLARCLLHEIDHLNGKLIIDYVSKGRQKIAAKLMRQMIKRAA